MTHPLSSRVVLETSCGFIPSFAPSNTVSNSAHVSPIYLGLDYCLQAKMRNNISQLPEHLSHPRVLDHFTTTRSVPVSLRMVAFRFMAVVSSAQDGNEPCHSERPRALEGVAGRAGEGAASSLLVLCSAPCWRWMPQYTCGESLRTFLQSY